MKHIDIAISQIAKCETPKGSNWGPDVQKYLTSVNIHIPASWCMAFVYWCCREAYGLDNKLVQTGGCLPQWQRINPAYKFVNHPQAGDIFIMDHGHGLGHTGIIERVEGNLLHTIEGNTNDTGSREGYEVARKGRIFPGSQIIGFIRLPK